MPSSLAQGITYRFMHISRKLTIRGSAVLSDTAVLSLVPRAAPASGEVGDMYMETGGVLKVCTVAGTPGTWVSVGAQV